jgi:AraC family transcriptional activator of pobA
MALRWYQAKSHLPFCTMLRSPSPTPLFRQFAIGPLACLRREMQLPVDAAAFVRWPQYAVVVVGASAASPSAVPLSLYFSSPGQLALAEVPTQAEGYVLRFTEEFVGLVSEELDLLLFNLFHRTEATGGLAVPAEHAAELAFLLTSVQRQAHDQAPLCHALLRAYLKTLLLYCLRLRQQQLGSSQAPQPNLYQRFRKLLEQHYRTWKSVAEYADHLRVTANHLSTAIRKETGLPASQHIRQRIVLEAQRLASLRNVPLKEVAYQLGFEDVSHFSKLFKRATGITFSRFKEQAWAQYSAQPASTHAELARAAADRPAVGGHYPLAVA